MESAKKASWDTAGKYACTFRRKGNLGPAKQLVNLTLEKADKAVILLIMKFAYWSTSHLLFWSSA
jgi:hypothetical protein